MPGLKVLSHFKAFSQSQLSVSGTVTFQNDGTPAPGVGVVVKGTNAGVSTGTDGTYSIQAGPADTLLFSFIGYITAEVPVAGRTLINVALEQNISELDEVVVVGYGTQRRKDLTGSIASVSAEEIREVAALNAMQAIQGKVPGLNVMQNSWNPGAEATIRIRGRRSFNASNDPLYVIDGIPIARGLNEINPSEIESIEVLKDASATAIYGSRGANGVVLITTKRGSAGKTVVDYEGYAGIQEPLRLLDIMDGPEFADFVRETYRNRNSNAYGSPVPSREEDQKLVIFTQDPYILESVLSAYDEQGNYDPSKVRSFDWIDAIMRQGFIQNHQLTVRGGTEKTQVGFSGGYYSNTGIMKGMDYARYSIRINIDHRMNDFLKVGTSSVLSHVFENSGSPLYGIARQQNPLATPYNPDGSLLLNPGNDALAVNPLLNIEGVIDEHRRNRVISSFYLEASPLEGLKYRANFGLDFRTARDGRFRSSMSTFQNGTPAWAEYGGNYAKGYTPENILTYDRTLNEKHTFGITLLQSIQSDRFEDYGQTVRGLPYEYQW
ncbi:MAG TPA: SusC/RagA family TonB-linked outer membrane protein, partial [Anseongella sp.]|nr:SusC/RagA family TonB-linked outer membrane protein [Anseongella sp.]